MSTPPTPSGPERIVYQGKILEIVEQPMAIGEKIVVFESARRSPGVRLIIPTSENKILLSKEYRSELGGYDYRLPGGKVFDTLTEFNDSLARKEDVVTSAEKAAMKESLEEVGITINELELFGISKCGATVEWDLYYFVARSFIVGTRQDSGEGEIITTVPVSHEEARAMCLEGRISEERSALMLLRYLNK